MVRPSGGNTFGRSGLHPGPHPNGGGPGFHRPIGTPIVPIGGGLVGVTNTGTVPIGPPVAVVTATVPGTSGTPTTPTNSGLGNVPTPVPTPGGPIVYPNGPPASGPPIAVYTATVPGTPDTPTTNPNPPVTVVTTTVPGTPTTNTIPPGVVTTNGGRWGRWRWMVAAAAVGGGWRRAATLIPHVPPATITTITGVIAAGISSMASGFTTTATAMVAMWPLPIRPSMAGFGLKTPGRGGHGGDRLITTPIRRLGWSPDGMSSNRVSAIMRDDGDVSNQTFYTTPSPRIGSGKVTPNNSYYVDPSDTFSYDSQDPAAVSNAQQAGYENHGFNEIECRGHPILPPEVAMIDGLKARAGWADAHRASCPCDAENTGKMPVLRTTREKCR